MDVNKEEDKMEAEMKRKEEEEEEEEHIIRFKSEVPLPPIPNTNYAAFVLNIFAQHGGEKAMMDSSSGEHHTFSDICALVPRVCAGLERAGVGVGEAVLLISQNHIDFHIASLAILLLPAVCVPASPALTPAELTYVVRVSGARWAVVEEGVVGTMEKLTPLLPPNTLREVWVMGASSSHPSFVSLVRTEAQKRYDNGGAFDAAKTMALMVRSSGTTGLPKGVMLSHRNLLTSIFQIKYITDLSSDAERKLLATPFERVLLFLPMYHILGYCASIQTITAGGCVVVMKQFSFPAFLHAIQQHKITGVNIVPHVARHLSQSPLVQEYDLSSLMVIVCGSAPLPATTQEAVTEKLGRFLGSGYGLTEICAAVTANSPRGGYKPGSVGRVRPYVDIKIVAPGTKKGLPRGEEGEVWVRGPGVMMGYVLGPEDSPSATPKGLEAGGWLPTGDLGKVDEEGFLFITDRIKDMIKVKGYQVVPSELEAVLLEMEGVEEVAVVGVPSLRLGEAPRAYVVPTPGVAAPSPKAIEEYLEARVAPYKRLEGGVELVESLPKNAVGKLIKRRLRDDFTKKTAAAGATATAVPDVKMYTGSPL